MRRLFLLLTSLLITMSIVAERIDRSTALQKAQRFMPDRIFVETTPVHSARAKTMCDTDAFHIFNVENNNGYVIVSSDDRTKEILGYANHGNLDIYHIPENLRWWLDEYARQIKALDTQLSPFSKVRKTFHPAISPLIMAKWSQGDPYNYMCPDSNYVDYNEPNYNPNIRCVTGCVATAMAQLMYYWKWPKSCPSIDGYQFDNHFVKALPSTSFKWNEMKDVYAWKEEGTSANAVAELMRYCGQAVKMKYQVSSSGANVSPTILASVFQYNANCRLLNRNAYSTEEWESIVYKELAALRPVLYSGFTSSSGHQFIVDGYDGNGLFHINWGWGGSLDSYFVLSIADPSEEQGTGGSTGAFQFNQQAIIGVEPANNGETVLPMMFEQISDNTLTTTYHRQLISDDFKDVSLEGLVKSEYNIPPTDILNAEIGWGLYQNDVLVQKLDSKSITIPAELQYSFNNNNKISFGAGLAEGKYQICQIYHFAGSSEWKRCERKEAFSLLAEVTPTSLTIKRPSNDDMSFVVNSMTITENPEIHKELSVSINITNTGEIPLLKVSLWVQKQGESEWTHKAMNTRYVYFGESAEVKFSFYPQVSGVHNLKITAGYSEVALKTATVKIPDAETIIIDGVAYCVTPDYHSAMVVFNENADKSQKNVTIRSKITINGVDCKVIDIDDYAFYNWDNLETVLLPEGVETIGAFAFSCFKLSNISPSSPTEKNVILLPSTIKSIGFHAFGSNHLVEKINIPEGVEVIMDEAFSHMNQLKRLELPSTLKRIGEDVIDNCNNLTYVISHINDPFSISDNTFMSSYLDSETGEKKYIPSPATLFIPFGTILKYGNIPGWTQFANIEEGELVESFVDKLRYSFASEGSTATVIYDDSYKDLTEVIIPANIIVYNKTYHVTAIAKKAFEQSYFLKTITLSKGLISIGEEAFQNTCIKNLVVPEGVETIGNGAFSYIHSLTKLELPSSLKYIGEEIIDGCENLTTIVSHISNPFFINDITFTTKKFNDSMQGYDHLPSPSILFVPIGTISKYKSFSGWKQFVNIFEGDPLEVQDNMLNYICSIESSAAIVAMNDSYNLTDVSVPSSISVDGKTLRVIHIRERAFAHCNNIKSVVISEGVETIGAYAFSNMGSLMRLELPNSLKNIGEGVVKHSTNLFAVVSHITDPFFVNELAFADEFVWNINTQQYEFTPSSATLYVPKGTLSKYITIPGWTCFSKIEEGEIQEIHMTLSYFCSNKNYTATVIRDDNYYKFTEIVIPSTINVDSITYRVTTIGENAFSGFGGIKSIVVSEGIEIIGDEAFSDMADLEHLELPNSLIKIGNSIIQFDNYLESVVSHIINPLVVSDNTFTNGYWWNEELQQYENEPSPATLYVPIGFKSLYESISGWNHFKRIEEGELKEVMIGELRYSYSTGGNTATVINDNSYYNLEKVEIPNSIFIGDKHYVINSIGNHAFYRCWKLSVLTLPDCLESIGNYGLSQTGISEISLPHSLKTIGDFAFDMCSGIKKLVIPEGVEDIGGAAFVDTGLLEITLPHSLRTIGGWAFSGLCDLKRLAIPEGVEVIGDYAFQAMKGLTRLELPSSLKQIGEGVISGSDNIEVVVSRITNPFNISDYTFGTLKLQNSSWHYEIIPSSATLYVPIGTKSAYEAINGWTNFAAIEESEEASSVVVVGGINISEDNWYNIKGVKVDKSYKGILIHKGRKIQVK